MRIFILTVSLFGVISGVYCECLLTCHRVWRCVTVLEYILVWCESVCGCINVCRAPPASLQAPLQNRVALCRTPAVLAAPGSGGGPLSPDRQAAAEPLQPRACEPILLGAIRHTDSHGEGGRRGAA